MNSVRKQGYTVPIGEPGSMRCCEWRWPKGEPVWIQSEKEGSSTYEDGPLREEGRQALLAHFSLERWADQLPLETLQAMPPCELHGMAVKLAVAAGTQPPEAPVSDRIGGHIPASLAA